MESEKTIKYLEKRGFSEEIIKDWYLVPGTNEILINYLDPNGKLLYKRRNRPGKKPKYISPPIKKMPGEHSSLYGLHMLKHVTDTLLLIEGEYNCISAWIMGYSALGVPGQAMKLKDYHLKYIPDTVKKIIILFDEPKLAETRAKEILEYFDFRIEVCIARYPDNKDANDYLIDDLHLEFKAIINIADRYFWDRLRSANFKVEIPEDDFVESYCNDYACVASDAPKAYEELMALAVIATILNRNVFLERGIFNLYPNLFIVLIGKSYIMRKTECLSMVKHLVMKINKKLIFPYEFTPEGLFNMLIDRPSGLIIWSEFGGFLASTFKTYQAGIKEFLTEAYSCPDFMIKRLSSKEYEIKNIYLNIITASTLHWFNKNIVEADIFGGFLGRFIYIPCEYKEKDRWYPDPNLPNKKVFNNLVLRLKRISDIKGKMTLSEEAKLIRMKWLRKHEDEIAGLDDSTGLSGFYGRLSDYLLKFAMLYEISGSNSNLMIISENSIMRAVKLVNWLKQSLYELMGEHIAFTKEAKDIQKILNLIKAEKTIKRDRLLQNSHMIAKQLDEVLSTLIQSNRIAEVYIKEGQREARAYKIFF